MEVKEICFGRKRTYRLPQSVDATALVRHTHMSSQVLQQCALSQELGDVDGDGANELIATDIHGHMFIIKVRFAMPPSIRDALL
jgi:hypothetical protein